MSYRDQVEALVDELMSSADEVAEMQSDLWCLDDAAMKEATFEAVHGDASKLRSMLLKRAEEVAERRMDDEEEEAANRGYEIAKARKRGEFE